MITDAMQEKISNSEYERAFIELAACLYEHYQKYKQDKQQEEITNTDENNIE